jgi:hypothetical protein
MVIRQQQQQNMAPGMLRMAAMAQRQFNELQRMTPEQRHNRMATSHDDIPINKPGDLMFFDGYAFSQLDFVQLSTACVEGDLPTVESVVTSQTRTPAFLHEGLVNALGSGNVDVARYLLDSGAPITKRTPTWALEAPKTSKCPYSNCFYSTGGLSIRLASTGLSCSRPLSALAMMLSLTGFSRTAQIRILTNMKIATVMADQKQAPARRSRLQR